MGLIVAQESALQHTRNKVGTQLQITIVTSNILQQVSLEDGGNTDEVGLVYDVNDGGDTTDTLSGSPTVKDGNA